MGKKFLAAVLALAMLAGVVPAFAVSETKKVGDDLVYTNDFSYSVEEMFEDPYLNWTWRDDKWAIEDGQLSTIGKQVTAFGFNSVLGKYGTHYEMETDFAVTEEEGADEIQHSFMVGTRVVGETNLHIDSGLWFMVKERQINVIVAKHAAEESVKVDVPFSFKTMRKIYVEDSQKEIKFYADNDNKEKTLLCTVSLTTDAINVADGSGAAKGSLKRYDVPDYGYVRFMAHYAAGKVDNLKVTYEPVDWSGISFDAFSPIEVGNAYSVNETGSAGVTWRMEDDSVVCFKSVDFGEGASYMGFNLSGGYNGCYGSVYIDSPDGEQVLDKAWLLANQYDGSWHEEIFPIKPVSGKHDIYLKIDKVVAARHSPQLSFIRFYKDQPEAYKGDESLEYADLSAPVRDLYADTWVGADDLDRKMPIGADAPTPKDKEVLAFYFMVNNEQTAGVKNYDNSKIIWANPQNPQWGTGSHYWGEPYFGYYASNDEWVIRRHAKMLTQAGVDAIVLDVTNHTTYDDVINAIFNTFAKMRQEGNDTPQISFMLPNSPDETANSAQYLYKTIYGLGRYKDLWYNFKGKPLLLGDSSSLTGELLDFFTWRKCWAWSAGKDQWSWVAHVPQPYGYHESAGTPEQVSVAMAQHATTNIGRSYSNGRQPDYKEPFGVDITTSGEGIYYKEQWDSALSVDPELVFITGFNEWVAGLYRTNADGTGGEDFLGVPKSPNSVYFVDNATPEYSRDFEPMRGFFYDNYYYQTVQNIRKYKGTRRQFDVGEKKTIDLAGDFSQWDDVCPEYRDSVGDTWHREAYGNHSNNFTENYYENTTGRNDIEAAKVARDDENMYFYVRCTQPITRPMDNWMVLYLNTDRLYKNGWQGYDFVVNHKLGTLEKFTGGWNFETVGEVDYIVNGREMMLAIPRQSLGLAAGEDITIDFKWADNSQNDGTVYDFMTLGDVAPDMRFNYRYTEDKAMVEKQVITDGAFDRGAKAAVTVENPLLTDMVVMQLGVAGGFVKNAFTPIDVVPAVVNDRTMVPLRFISEAFGAQVDWDGNTQTATVTSGVYDKITVQFTIGSDTMLVNGAAKTIDAPPVLQDDRTLLPIRALSEALGKNVLWDNDTRIIIIGSKEQDFDALAQNRGLLDYINLKFETVK